MKLTIKETFTKEVEITLPAYRKKEDNVVRVEGESGYTKVYKSAQDAFAISGFPNLSTEEFFRGDWQPATEEDFQTMLSAAIVLMSQERTEA